MTEQDTTNKASLNGHIPPTSRLKGRKKQWRDLPTDSLAEGFDSHQAEYIVGKSPLTWAMLTPGQLFARSKSGKSLYVKINDGRAIGLDTRQAIDIKPSIRLTLQVWLVTSFNSTTASKADF